MTSKPIEAPCETPCDTPTDLQVIAALAPNAAIEAPDEFNTILDSLTNAVPLAVLVGVVERRLRAASRSIPPSLSRGLRAMGRDHCELFVERLRMRFP